MNVKRIKKTSLGLIVSTLLLPVSISFANQITLERKSSSIEAKLQDNNDYFYLASGKKQTLYRKKDVYVVRSSSAKKSSQSDVMSRFKAGYGDRVEKVKAHSFGSTLVVKLDNSVNTKRIPGESYSVEPQMLKRMDNSIANLDPVFTLGAGKGDLMLLPRITFAIQDSSKLEEILKTYNLTLHRKLNLTDNVYSTMLNATDSSASTTLQLVRSLSANANVSWAEPQFHFKPVKLQYTPNDTLLDEQWHLRDQGYKGSRCDTDCDANNAWDISNANGTGAVTGENTVIAIIDDGVQTNHPDLSANIAPNEFDFVDDSTATGACLNGASLNDGTPGQDSNADPKPTTNCTLVEGEAPLQEDNHGTAVAGVAAAVGNNGAGVAGVAYNAKILPIRAISDFDQAPIVAGTDYDNYCSTLAEAFEYAAQHADVINASWQLPVECSVLEMALTRVTAGTVTIGSGSRRSGGSPVIFASGNDASGWVKVTVDVSEGEHAYEWRYLRSPDPDFNDNNALVEQTAWVDEITWPTGDIEGFESISSINSDSNDFSTQWTLDSCNAECTFSLGTEPTWQIDSNASRAFEGSRSASIATDGSDCGNSYLHIIKGGPAGSMSFWVWASVNSEVDSDKFEFLLDGQEVLSYGDLAAFGFKNDNVAYPASLSATNTGIIAVGASTNGDLSGDTATALDREERAAYSQFGASLDVVAPGSNQQVGIVTTDRTGNAGYNSTSASDDLSDRAYTQFFYGTSASAAIVSGVSSAVIASNPTFSAADVKQRIRDTADKIGTVAYAGGRNDQYGYGRVNMYRAITNASTAPAASCSPDTFDFTSDDDLFSFETQPQSIGFCPAQGETVENEAPCIPVRTRLGKVAVICL